MDTPWTGMTTAMATPVGMPPRVRSMWAGTIGSGHAPAVGMANRLARSRQLTSDG